MRTLALLLFLASGFVFLCDGLEVAFLEPAWGFMLGAAGMAAHVAEDLG